MCLCMCHSIVSKFPSNERQLVFSSQCLSNFSWSSLYHKVLTIILLLERINSCTLFFCVWLDYQTNKLSFYCFMNLNKDFMIVKIRVNISWSRCYVKFIEWYWFVCVLFSYSNKRNTIFVAKIVQIWLIENDEIFNTKICFSYNRRGWPTKTFVFLPSTEPA